MESGMTTGINETQSTIFRMGIKIRKHVSLQKLEYLYVLSRRWFAFPQYNI